MSHEKVTAFLKEIGIDFSIGTGSYLAILHLDWIQEAQHIITGLITALVCCVGVHYLRKILAWFDKWVNKLFKSKK